eukprot:6201813-Pleurochrysis_carterae.AAC.2
MAVPVSLGICRSMHVRTHFTIHNCALRAALRAASVCGVKRVLLCLHVQTRMRAHVCACAQACAARRCVRCASLRAPTGSGRLVARLREDEGGERPAHAVARVDEQREARRLVCAREDKNWLAQASHCCAKRLHLIGDSACLRNERNTRAALRSPTRDQLGDAEGTAILLAHAGLHLSRESTTIAAQSESRRVWAMAIVTAGCWRAHASGLGAPGRAPPG